MSVVEKVAAEIKAERIKWGWDILKGTRRPSAIDELLAVAVLKALREPSVEMLKAVDDDPYDDPMVARGRAYSAWVSMIDAALDGEG
ncbi:hypothetical protein H5V43_01780 [Sphingobium fuliginis]|jgi:hypothetical protein|uniref:Uncharacterized protein n=1 Tax=Sphingobium fuliginis (strain ATCC 27551) TaxID=336203 RepID=A0A7M2GIK5_SPHSA|nr:hypothetical protein [Sphingobium fuliginis]QOT71932.1 hypothetical protein H5V43_01780 [Sphingobium fuliginis]